MAQVALPKAACTGSQCMLPGLCTSSSYSGFRALLESTPDFPEALSQALQQLAHYSSILVSSPVDFRVATEACNECIHWYPRDMETLGINCFLPLVLMGPCAIVVQHTRHLGTGSERSGAEAEPPEAVIHCNCRPRLPSTAPVQCLRSSGCTAAVRPISVALLHGGH
eukprot:jgi/Ulvmu1/4248/UM192_0008.1